MNWYHFQHVSLNLDNIAAIGVKDRKGDSSCLVATLPNLETVIIAEGTGEEVITFFKNFQRKLSEMQP